MQRLLLAAFCAALPACTSSTSPEAELVPIGAAGDPALSPLPDPEEQGGHVGRAPRRLTVAQLDRSIEVATGQRWDELPRLAASLGQADYALVNMESTEPNLVFAKFVEEGARKVCAAAAQADLSKTAAKDRLLAQKLPDDIADFTRLPEAAVRENLRHLSLRFWGRELEGAELDRGTGFFQRSAAAGALKGGLRHQVLTAACTALITDTRFLFY